MTAFFSDLARDVPDYVPGSFNSCFPQPMRGGRPPSQKNLPEAQHKECPTPLTDAEQWRQDLETLDRIERQNDCFFDAMGAIAAGRAHG